MKGWQIRVEKREAGTSRRRLTTLEEGEKELWKKEIHYFENVEEGILEKEITLEKERTLEKGPPKLFHNNAESKVRKLENNIQTFSGTLK